MKKLLMLSGKGGTGKTTIAGAFIALSGARAYADCDVDAPNLHLVLAHASEPRRTDYFGLPKAEIDPGRCASCGLCLQHCRFDAVSMRDGEYVVERYACEGCGVCLEVCPAHAVSLVPDVAGELLLYAGEDRTFSTARLRMGSGTTGRLVTAVKKQMEAAAPDVELAIIDGSPGIGCPVIASMSGADMILIVAEPSVSGINDLERIVRTAKAMGTAIAVCINKHDVHEGLSERIEDYCRENGLALVGRIPFDREAIRAVNDGKTIAEVDCAAGRAARNVYIQTMALFRGDGGDDSA